MVIYVMKVYSLMKTVTSDKNEKNLISLGEIDKIVKLLNYEINYFNFFKRYA